MCLAPRRLPVRWEKTVIVVLDEVRISSPYRPENASGGNAQSLERVRKVVSGSDPVHNTSQGFAGCVGSVF